MLSIVVLISGGGSNVRDLIARAAHADFPVRIVAVGSDRDAEGLAHADAAGVPTFLVPFDPADRAGWAAELLARVREWEADLVVLSGFMRILPASFVSALSPRLLNTHPAHLPEFPGAHGVRDALAAGATETGASVHVVDAGVDTGPILAQERIAVLPGDTEQTLHDRIKPVERRLLAETLVRIADGSLNLREIHA